MRSVFVLLRDATEVEVAAYLDRAYPGRPAPPWVSPGCDGPSLYIHFWRGLSRDLDPLEYADLVGRFGGEPAGAVMADVSGRIPGVAEASGFAIGLLEHFGGAALDDHSLHLWSLAELRAGHRASGQRFFDHDGRHEEGRRRP